jgi:hypothetical protein
MATNFLVPGFNKIGQLDTDNQGGIIGPDNDPVINDLITAFNSPGTFTKSPAANTATLLVVAGGGGAANRGGGGGAGGARLVTTHPLPASPVPVSVGAGGAGAGFPNSQQPGNTSTFGSSVPISTTGGGRGGIRPYPPGQNTNPNGPGAPGGSGGGGGRGFQNTPAPNNGPGSGTPGQGNPGGSGFPDPAATGGGGGGYSQAGSGGSGGPAKGGDGLDITTYFPSAYGFLAPSDGLRYVAGGGTGTSPGGIPVGTKGGGGKGQGNSPVEGVDGTGGGGGSEYSNPGGSGGDGIVLVNQPKAGPSVSSGVWSLKAQYTAKILGNWPS